MPTSVSIHPCFQTINCLRSFHLIKFFFHGIINVDTSTPEVEFWERPKCDVPLIYFERTSVNKEENLTLTRIVELIILTTKNPSAYLRHFLSIFKYSFTTTMQKLSAVWPYIKILSQCSKMQPLRQSNHSISSCTVAQTTDPCCIFCHSLYLTTDRSCQQWDFQRGILKNHAHRKYVFSRSFHVQEKVSCLLNFYLY